jgi:hypothetical protein
MEFTVIQGDIAAQGADVLVNAAGTSLEMGSGVAGALTSSTRLKPWDSSRWGSSPGISALPHGGNLRVRMLLVGTMSV